MVEGRRITSPAVSTVTAVPTGAAQSQWQLLLCMGRWKSQTGMRGGD